MILLLFSGSTAAVVIIDTTLPALESALAIGINPLEWLVDQGGGWAVSDSGEWPVESTVGWSASLGNEWPVDEGSEWS